jgi:hypothetical protein
VLYGNFPELGDKAVKAMLVRHWEAHSLSLSYLTSQQPHGVSSV